VSGSLLSPRGIAVVGASQKPGSLGGKVLAGIVGHGYRGDLCAVNPAYADIEGTACYPSLSSIPHSVDLVLVFVKAQQTLEVLKDAAACGASNAVVFSSGFAEMGELGRAQQAELAAITEQSKLRVLGPNCQGLVDFRTGLTATFSPALLADDLGEKSAVAYVGQSGAIGGAFFDLARIRGVVPVAWASTGNQVDLDVVEVASQFLDQGPLDLLCLYLEQLPDGVAWINLVRRASEASTRVAVLRCGRSASGSRATASHTGAINSSDLPFNLVCDQFGVAQVDDIDELIDMAVAVKGGKQSIGRRMAVVTTSGGAGALAADHFEAASLELAVLSADTSRQLSPLVPDFGSIANPVDVTAEVMTQRPGDLAEVVRVLSEDVDVDHVMVVLTNVVGEPASVVSVALTRPFSKPISVVYLAARDRVGLPLATLSSANVPVFESIGSAVRTIQLLTSQVRLSPTSIPPVLVTLPPLPNRSTLTEADMGPLLDAVGVQRPMSLLVSPEPETVESAARSIGGKVVVKLQSTDLLHKSELGAVAVGISGSEAGAVVTKMLERVSGAKPDAVIDGVLVQTYVPNGAELLVGIVGPGGGYPPVVTVGMGGTSVEIYRDVASAFAPLDEVQALALLRSLRMSPLFEGFRGQEVLDIEAAARAISALSRLAVSITGLFELEVNPLIVHASGAVAVDALLRRDLGE
jgi:acetate---CoA ligase (ADP-forming)